MAWKPLDTEPQLPELDGATLIDSHCHLDMDFDADREAVLERARRHGIAHMVTIGASGSFGANDKAVALAARHAMLSATVGVHPHEAASVTDETIDRLTTLAAEPKVVAIGESGLDYHYEHSPRPAQRAAFARFIQLARQLGLPIVVHLRDAARIVPRDRLLVETDAPFLAPIPFRGRRNEPALIVQTAATLAEVRGESLPAVARATSENARRLFRIQ
jgi:TatD DNase family protein